MRWISLLALVALSGCVERRLWIRTEPAGAIVSINGEVVGASPVSWRFYQYGVVLMEAEKEGYAPMERKVRLVKPWFQQPVADFFADIVIPYRVHDDHELNVVLQRDPPRDEAALDAEVAALARAAKRAREAER